MYVAHIRLTASYRLHKLHGRCIFPSDPHTRVRFTLIRGSGGDKDCLMKPSFASGTTDKNFALQAMSSRPRNPPQGIVSACNASPKVDRHYLGGRDGRDESDLLCFQSVEGQHSETIITATCKTDAIMIIFLTSSAILPLVMGILFYISLGLNASDGQHFGNGTFVRPVHQGLGFRGFGSNSIASFVVSPMTISTIASTLIGSISATVMSLLALHLGNLWILQSKGQSGQLPTPYQYYLVHSLTSAAPTAMLKFLVYAFWKSPSRNVGCVNNGPPPGSTKKPLRPGVARKKRARIGPIVLLGAFGLFTTLSFSLAIRALDAWLHQNFKYTKAEVRLGGTHPDFLGAASLEASCNNNTGLSCPVIDRAIAASLGGLNQSSDFSVHSAPFMSETIINASQPYGQNSSLAFLGPAQLYPRLSGTARTYALSTTCAVYRPKCDSSRETHTITNCGALKFPVEVLFDTLRLDNRPQVFLSHSAPKRKLLETSTNQNPFNMIGFACFNDYSHIQHSETNDSFHTPFFNWWELEGYGFRPFILCFTLSCNSTIYDAVYSVALGGSLKLHTDQLKPSNASLAMVISAPLPYLEQHPIKTTYYRYTQRYIDDQFQSDLLTAGNAYGNESTVFAGAVAQSLSNRLLGWSAGAITMKPAPATWVDEQVAISFHLRPAYIYSILHFLYAGVIVALGLSCFAIPAQHRTGYTVKTTGRGSSTKAVTTLSKVEMAQMRICDASTIVKEMVIRDGCNRQENGSRSITIHSDDSKADAAVNLGLGWIGTTTLEDLEAKDEGSADGKHIRMALREDSHGVLQMDMS